MSTLASCSAATTGHGVCYCSKIAESPEEHGVEEYRFNDGKISPGGVFIGGRMHKTSATAEGKHGRWYKLEWRKEAGKSRLVQVSQQTMQVLFIGCRISRCHFMPTDGQF